MYFGKYLCVLEEPAVSILQETVTFIVTTLRTLNPTVTVFQNVFIAHSCGPCILVDISIKSQREATVHKCETSRDE